MRQQPEVFSAHAHLQTGRGERVPRQLSDFAVYFVHEALVFSADEHRQTNFLVDLIRGPDEHFL